MCTVSLDRDSCGSRGRTNDNRAVWTSNVYNLAVDNVVGSLTDFVAADADV